MAQMSNVTMCIQSTFSSAQQRLLQLYMHMIVLNNFPEDSSGADARIMIFPHHQVCKLHCAFVQCTHMISGHGLCAGDTSSEGELISASRQDGMEEVRTANDTIVLERKFVACKIPIASQNLKAAKPSSAHRVTRQKVVRSSTSKQRPVKYIEE